MTQSSRRVSTALSPAQHGVWLTERALAADAAYHLAVTVDLAGPLDPDRLLRACAAVAAHHPALTTGFGPEGDPRPVPAGTPRRAACAEDGLDAFLADERSRPFDLAAGPVHRFVLVALAPARHVLSLTVHHLAFDGESKERLVADLAAAYRGEPSAPAGTPPHAEPAARAVADAEAFWAPRWQEPDLPRLPGLAAVPGAGTQPAPGAEVAFALGADRAARLDGVARRLGITRFELLTASWHALLARYGDPAPVTSVELSLRRPGTPVAVGLAVNELPLSSTWSPHTPFATWSQSVRAGLRALYAHRDVPLGRCVRGLTPRTALTPLSVSYRRRPHDGRPDFGPQVRADVRWTGFCGTARNLLHAQWVDTGSEVLTSLQFRSDALTADAVRRIAGHWTTLLDGALTDPATPLGELPLLTDAETAAHLATDAPRPGLARRTVPELFAEAARTRPGAVAVVSGAATLTYGELADRVARAAAVLRARGADPGTLVGIALPRGTDQLVTVLAVLACGAAYLPLDPDYPSQRLEFLRADARPALCVTALPAGPDELGPADLAAPGLRPAALPPPAPSDPAYVLYTSGSTGRPKGVEVPHAALANVLGALRDHLGSAPGNRWLALTSLSFDICVVELLLPLTTGGSVVLVPEGAHRDGPLLLDLVKNQGITHVQATPSGWRMLLDAGLADIATGLTALTGGEALPDDLATELAEVSERLLNVYGPTETTVWSTLAEPVRATDGRVRIGRPLANTRAYVLDAGMRIVPDGLPGELFLGGTGVAHGYVRRPGLTARRFVPDPFGPPGSRLYRTGDVVRRLPDGSLVHLGRDDTQIKLRGHRIELGEIETRLAAHPDVAQAVVTVRGDPGRQWLAAYVVLSGPAAPSAADLRAHLAASLPAAALPATCTALDAFPLTPNGKLDRAALPEPVLPRTAPGGDSGRDAGQDAVTQAVLDIWRAVLELDDLGPDEDLFDLGGHSLTITAIAARIHRALGVDVPLDVFFDTPTVHGVSSAVTALRKEQTP
ncbi:amino acid adenylation domain-containing protein [Streptomyces sp. NPDC001904]|uniref:non-ribosomal peptide synthetase n=1 Tax=Streptomyces sp. NPDC001904 TaxID=3154531 RepID=UPI00332EE89D